RDDELAEPVEPLDAALGNEIAAVEIDLRGDTAVIQRRIESRDAAHGRPLGAETLPQGFARDSDRRDRSNAGDHHTTLFSHAHFSCTTGVSRTFSYVREPGKGARCDSVHEDRANDGTGHHFSNHRDRRSVPAVYDADASAAGHGKETPLHFHPCRDPPDVPVAHDRRRPWAARRTDHHLRGPPGGPSSDAERPI